MTDGIEQKIDKLMVMMAKLVTEDEGQSRQFKPQVYQSNRGRGQSRCNYDQRRFQDRFRPNNAYRDDQGMDKTTEVGQDMTLITEVVMGTIWEVIKGMEDQKIIIIIITEGETLGTRIMIEIGVGHMKDKTEIERIAEALVTEDQGQVPGQLQIEIGSDALSVGNMTTLQGTAQLGRQVGKENKFNKCLIWMKIRQSYKPHWWT